MTDPITDPANDRNTVIPVVFHDIWNLYKKHEAAIWHSHEVQLEQDSEDWQKLTPDEQHFIKMVLAFFASSDKIVSENLAVRFMAEVQIPESKQFLGWQNAMEGIHSETYANMIEAYIKDGEEKKRLFNAVDTCECVKKKATWAKRWINSDQPFPVRLVAFAIVEGIFFSGSFCAIYWMAERKMLKGLCKGNEFIARDEGLHVEHAVLLYTRYVVNKLSNKQFEEILRDAVDMEVEFINEAIPCRLIGINQDSMEQYIKYCANQLSYRMGHAELYRDVKQPFAFMDSICLREKQNFFEGKVGAYSMVPLTDVKEDDMFGDL